MALTLDPFVRMLPTPSAVVRSTKSHDASSAPTFIIQSDQARAIRIELAVTPADFLRADDQESKSAQFRKLSGPQGSVALGIGGFPASKLAQKMVNTGFFFQTFWAPDPSVWNVLARNQDRVYYRAVADDMIGALNDIPTDATANFIH